jgi:hypothetical protein
VRHLVLLIVVLAVVWIGVRLARRHGSGTP